MAFVIYLRGEDGKFEKVETAGCLSAYLGDDSVHEVILYPCKTHSSRVYRYKEVTMFRDLDLSKPAPDDVTCVVCEQVTGELCEGDILKVFSNNDNYTFDVAIWYSQGKLQWMAGSGRCDDTLSGLLGHPGCRIERLSHHLTHHPEKEKIRKL